MPVEDFADFISSKVPKGKIVELGIGFQFKVALRLKELGFDVLAVDWNEESVRAAIRAGIDAFQDDIFNPRRELYRGAVALYAVRPTPEILVPIISLSDRLKLPLFILPLAGDTMPRGMKLVNYRGLPVYAKGI
ncbi:UPF0146 family protein [Thermococcus sp. Bubb.Bath]|uniref:UPF0146 family protein n=1 Tax=Thermococcus sp. Bubb.Bath TaxID=1638242 RepID=UPI00143C5016|nr:UPF0146 family protein [Thermococcus sp. Bubb.Bath]NJF25611.1 hypothetical protein [Thermococcus sp. Bubb.Bath]